MNAFTKYKVIIFSLDNLLLLMGSFTLSLAPIGFGGVINPALALLLQVVGLMLLVIVFMIKFRFAPPERGKIMPFIILYGIGFITTGMLIGFYFTYYYGWLLALMILSHVICTVILALLRVSFFGK